MSAAPEFVARLEAIIAEHRATGRKLAQLALDASQGTAEVKGPCLRCSDRGVVVGANPDEPSFACTCESGRPFREAALRQARRAAGMANERPVFLPNDGNKSGRDRQTGERE